MKLTSNKISVKEKIGFSLGDLAANLIFQTLMTFLAYFYTDVYKIEPTAASKIIFIGGMIGALVNPIVGLIADRTKSKWGKYRPWVLWTSIPFGVMAILAFVTPQLNFEDKVIYALISYTLLAVVYSANNVPYSALGAVISGDMDQRNSLFSYRFVAVLIAQFIVQTLLLPLVMILGDGDKIKGFESSIAIFALIGVVLFVITFYTTKERIKPIDNQNVNLVSDFKALLHNRPGIILFIVTIFVFISLALKTGMYVYYFKHYLSEPHMAKFLNDIGFNTYVEGLNSFFKGVGLIGFEWPEDTAASAFGLYNAVGIILMLVGVVNSKKLANKYGKKDVFSTGLLLSAFTLFLYVFYDSESVGLVFFTQILHGFSYGITIPLLWAMIADVADFSEWKHNRRATAFSFSIMIFGLKVGLSIGGALVTTLLARYGYQEVLISQNSEINTVIKMSVSIYPAVIFMLGVLCLIFYEINKGKEIEIENELNNRRKSIH